MKLKNEHYEIEVEELPLVGETLRLYMSEWLPEDTTPSVASAEISAGYFSNGDGAYVLRRVDEVTLVECAGRRRAYRITGK